MCTVTYIPRGSNDYLLTSNRDELPSRSPKTITQIRMKKQSLYFPRDKGAGGTWISASNTNKVVCLLNGAFEKHVRKSSYRRSRGLMVLDFFEFEKTSHFFSQYQFKGMEPFTMIIRDEKELHEIRWDESTLHCKNLDPEESFIWSSSTLYDERAKTKRKKWFQNWRKANPTPELSQVLHFHQTAGDGDPWNDVVMNRNEMVKTVSITSIQKEDHTIEFTYRDLLDQHISTSKIHLSREMVGTTQI